MGFDAAKAVEPLDWDFSKFGGGKGNIPEPTAKQVGRLFGRLDRDVRAALAKVNVEADADVPPDKLLEAAEAAIEDSEHISTGLHDALTATYAEFCHGSPTKAQIAKLPFRVRMAFFRWIAEEFGPEASGAGTSSPQLSIVRGA